MRNSITRPITEKITKSVVEPISAPANGGGVVAPSNALSLGANNLLYLGTPNESGYTNVLTLGEAV